MNFSDMKKNRRAGFEKLQQQVESSTNPGNKYKDARFFELTTGKDGNGSATLRFLPAAEGEDFPYVLVFNHAFKAAGGWYIENCLTTVGQNDPVVEYNKSVFDRGLDAQGRSQARKKQYIANVYVVEDPGNPENNGKVMLFKFGQKIFDMINSVMFPEDDDEQGFNPFDLWEGANFKLKKKTILVDGNKFPNYDNSKFVAPAALKDDDGELQKIWQSQHKLGAFLDVTTPDQFKSYDKLKQRLIEVVGPDAAAFFNVASGGQAPSAPASSGKTANARSAPAVLVDDDDDDDGDGVDTKLSLDGLSGDDDDDLPFDLDDDDDDIESFQDLSD